MSPDSLYPAAITSCADEPAVPPRPLDAKGQPLPRPPEVKAQYTADLHGAYADCKDTVAATAKRKADYAKQYDISREPAWKKALPHISFGSKKAP